MYQNNNKKTFCFAPILSKPQFSSDRIKLQDNYFSIVFSAYNYLYALHFYNAFLNQKFKKFSLNQNSIILNSISMIAEKEINQDHIKIKMASPIICRNHNQETKKDMYYSFEREKFNKFIKINILEQMKAENLDESLLEGFTLIPLNARKTVVTLYEKQIECSLGIFELRGKKELIAYLYKAGIGSKKAMGFGLFEIL